MFIYSFMFQFNNMIDFCIVPTSRKVANITPVFKKVKNSKKNYRPVSILPNISKVCKRCLFKQMSNYFSVFQCGCRKDFSSQYCWMSMIEKWKESVDKKKTSAAIFTDLSKASDFLTHVFIIAKRSAYGFSLSVLRFIQSYLLN